MLAKTTCLLNARLLLWVLRTRLLKAQQRMHHSYIPVEGLFESLRGGLRVSDMWSFESSSGWDVMAVVWRAGCVLRMSVWGFDCRLGWAWDWDWGRRLLNPANSWLTKASIERVCSARTLAMSRSSRAWFCSHWRSSHMFCVCCILSRKSWYWVCNALQQVLLRLNIPEQNTKDRTECMTLSDSFHVNKYWSQPILSQILGWSGYFLGVLSHVISFFWMIQRTICH